jgi:acyl-CoA thioester hydrolase
MIHDEMTIRIRYSDTDQMKVVYYAEYYKYFEDGRANLLRNLNFPYSSLELEYGVFLPVSESFAKYHKSAKFEDLITVRTSIKEIPTKIIQFDSAVYKNDSLLVSGYTKHLFVNSEDKIVHCPKELIIAIQKSL